MFSRFSKHGLTLIALALCLGMATAAFAQEPTIPCDAEVAPTDIENLIERGRSCVRDREYELALADGNAALALDPDSVGGLVLRGSAQAYLRQFDAAFADLNRAIELDPLFARAYFNRAIAYGMIEEYELGLADVSQAIGLDPENYRSYGLRANMHTTLGNFEAALADANRSLELNPDWEYALNERGDAYYELGEYELAIADYNRTFELGSTDLTTYVMRAKALTHLGLHAEGARDFLTWIEGAEMPIIESGRLSNGNSVRVDMAEYMAYAFQFKAAAGNVLTIETIADGGTEVDTLLLVLNADGEPVIGGDDRANWDYQAAIEGFEVPESGVYTVLLAQSFSSVWGEVEIALNLE